MQSPIEPIRNRFNSPVTPIRRLLTEQQLAIELNVSVRTLQQWRFKGGGPRFLKLGAAVRYDWAHVEVWLEGKGRESTSDPGPEVA